MIYYFMEIDMDVNVLEVTGQYERDGVIWD